MLRAFRPDTVLGKVHLSRTSRANTYSMRHTRSDFLAKDWLRAAALLTAMLLFSRIQPVIALAPIALAFFAAALSAGAHPLPMLTGCILGSVRPEGFQIALPVGAGIILLGYLVWGFMEQRLQRPNGRASPDSGSLDSVVAALAGLGVLLPSIPIAAGNTAQFFSAIISALAAVACAPFFRALVLVRPSRRHLMPEERIGLMIFLCASAAGLATIYIPAAMTAALFVVLLYSAFGAGACAGAGLAAGCSLYFMTGNAQHIAALGVCGLMTGLSPPGQRWMPVVILVPAAVFSSLLLGSELFVPICAALAGVAYLAAPERPLLRARQWLNDEQNGVCDPDRLAARLRGETERRLRAMSAAFGELSESYRLPVNLPEEQTVLNDMRQKLCDGCSSYKDCWAGDDNDAVRFLCQLISEAIDWANGDCAEPLFPEEAHPDTMRVCRRGRSVPARLGHLLEDFAKTRRAEMKRAAANQLISAQFMQAQMLLCGLAEQQARPIRIRGRQAARARAALDRAQIEVREVMALRSAQMEIIATLKREQWTPALAESAARQLSAVFGRLYAPESVAGFGTPEMKFVRLPRLRAMAAASCHSCKAGVPCGDSHMIRMLEGDRLLMLLSDGMGSGEEAARESAQTLRLLWQFLSADVSRALALETVNELMLARSGEDMFATVDMCLIDLSTGMAEFSKLAACRSLIAHEGEVIPVEGGRLPLGILEKVQPSVCRVQLRPGDVVLMATDGVMDTVDEGILSDILLDETITDASALAEIIVGEAERRGNDRRRDDMTALCARITDRRAV